MPGGGLGKKLAHQGEEYDASGDGPECGDAEMMTICSNDRRKQLLNVVGILGSLIRNIALKKALHRAHADPHLNFWRLIYGNQMDVPVLEWCKLFGSDDSDKQPIHWKSVVADQDAFRNGLLSDLGIDRAAWNAYWEEMKKYRDMNVAHHDPGRESIPFFPKLDLALGSACYYYDYVRAELAKLHVDQQPSDVRRYAREFEEECFEIAVAAIAATAGMKEKMV
jgi:hypothetical protein